MAVKPNILWIVTTQWRAQAAGFAGDVNARTPYLDTLAGQALNFAQAVTPHPFGPFARAALLTGVVSPENGVRDYFDPLPRNARTIAHELAGRGYETAFFGKWHLGRRDPLAPLVGEAHAKTLVPVEARGGFEFWEGFESGFLLNDPWLHGSALEEPKKFEGYQSDVVCGRAEGWMKARARARAAAPAQITNARLQTPKAGAAEERPWFCVVSLEAPHPPYGAEANGVKPLEPGAVILARNVPRGGEVEAKARRELAGYYAHIQATDTAIGRMLEALDAADAPDGGNTLIVFTSVHGDMHGAHGLFRKGWPHEESVRVPLLVRLPGRGEEARAGENRNDAVSLVDLGAMTLGWVDRGVFRARSRGADGGAGGWAEISMPSVVALPQQCDRVWRGVRTATRKLVLDAAGKPWLFFDLENDPLELRNLAGEAAWAREIAELRTLVGS